MAKTKILGLFLSRLFIFSFMVIPLFALAQYPPGVNYTYNQPAAVGNIGYLLNAVSGWVSTLSTLLIGLGVLIFFWGIIKYVISGGDEEKRKQSRGLIIYGIIGLFVMVAIWGIIYFIASVFGIQIGGPVSLPAIPCVLGSSGCVPTP